MSGKLLTIIVLTLVVFLAGCESEASRLTRENYRLSSSLTNCQVNAEKNQHDLNIATSKLNDKTVTLDKIMELVSQGRCAEALAFYQNIQQHELNREEQIKGEFSDFISYTLITLSVICLVVMCLLLLAGIFITNSFLEGFIRTLALVIGFIVYFVSKSAGVSIPSLLLSSILVINPIFFIITGVIIPLFTGAFVAWYILRKINEHNNYAYRICLLIGVLVVSLFTDVFVSAYASPSVNKLLIPNLTFIVGIGFYIIFRFNK